MVYTGCGSSNTPPAIKDLMTNIGISFGRAGLTLRCSDGPADKAFIQGSDFAGGDKQVFLPPKQYRGDKQVFLLPKQYRGNTTHPMGNYFNIGYDPLITNTAMAWAKKIWELRRPNWGDLRIFEKYQQACVSLQLMGPHMSSPSRLVVCWTDNDELDQCIKMAEVISISPDIDYVIPVLNLYIKSNRDLIKDTIDRHINPIGLIQSLQRSASIRFRKGMHK